MRSSYAAFLCVIVFALDKIWLMKWALRYGGATYQKNVTDTVNTVQYSDSQYTQQQYWHERRHCSWMHAGLYCIAPRPFTRFVFYLESYPPFMS